MQHTTNCTPTEGFTYKASHDIFSTAGWSVFSTYQWRRLCAVDLNLDLDYANAQITQLDNRNWIDRKTRFVVLEASSFNVNFRLFSRLKTYFEISEAGQVLACHKTDSMRLYPYVEIGDYVTLGAQLLFIALFIIKLLWFIHNMTKCRFTSAAAVDFIVDLTRLLLALGYVVFYIWRIDRTIYKIEVLRNSKGNIKY